jgi:hypothetical protein
MIISHNEGKSAASFYHHVAARFPDMFCNFYLVKNHKIDKNSTTAKASDKISADLECLEFHTFYVCLTKFKHSQTLLIKLATDFY